jgi:hypothetical protein
VDRELVLQIRMTRGVLVVFVLVVAVAAALAAGAAAGADPSEAQQAETAAADSNKPARFVCSFEDRPCLYAHNRGGWPAARFSASAGKPPFRVGRDSGKVVNLNADELDGLGAQAIIDEAVERGAGSRAPTGPAGGDLTGDYPDPSLADGGIDSTGLFTPGLRDGAPDTPTLRSLGTDGDQATAGDDPRLPTQAENDALAGTQGDPGAGNRYVTNSDPRNTNARTPTGPAGGDLTGDYPDPSLAAGAVDSTALFASGAVPAVRVGVANDQPNNSGAFNWSAEAFDTADMWNPSEPVCLRAPVAGLYQLDLNMKVRTPGAATIVLTSFDVAGGDFFAESTTPTRGAGSLNEAAGVLTQLVRLDAGECTAVQLTSTNPPETVIRDTTSASLRWVGPPPSS